MADRDCRRDIARVVADVDGVTPTDVDRAASASVETATVGEAHEHCVFEVTGLDCRTCAGATPSTSATTRPTSRRQSRSDIAMWVWVWVRPHPWSSVL